jgi:uncharacterized protein YndB with AHSA1/START domain
MPSRLAPAIFAAVPALLIAVPPARAEVLDSQASGFTVRQTVEIAAPPAKVWEALGHVSAWWDPNHTFSQDAKNVSIDMKVGGCWCESFPGGGGARHMVIVFVQPEQTLRAIGAIGPLQAFGATGSMTWTLKAQGARTLVSLTYDVGGHAPEGLDKLSAPVDRVLGEQARRLQSYVEAGKP